MTGVILVTVGKVVSAGIPLQKMKLEVVATLGSGLNIVTEVTLLTVVSVATVETIK